MTETFLYVGSKVDIDQRDLPALKAKFLVEHTPTGATVLDIGCGGGKMLQTVAFYRDGLTLLGCDVKEPLELPQSVSFTLVDPADAVLPYEEASVDAVLMIDVLEHVHDPVATLNSVHNILRPGGRLLAFIPVEGEPVGWYTLYRRLFGDDLYVVTKEHVQAYRHRDVDALLGDSFTVVDRQYAYHFLGQFMDATLCALLKFDPIRDLFWSSSPYHGSGSGGSSLTGRVLGRMMTWANAVAWAESRVLRRVRVGSGGVLVDARRRD